jgi:hypothetical protein
MDIFICFPPCRPDSGEKLETMLAEVSTQLARADAAECGPLLLQQLQERKQRLQQAVVLVQRINVSCFINLNFRIIIPRGTQDGTTAESDEMKAHLLQQAS